MTVDELIDNGLRSVEIAKELYCKKYYDGETVDDETDFDWVCMQFNDALTCLERLRNIAVEGVKHDD